MANEATIRTSLSIRKDNLQYQSLPSGFTADVTGTKGPVPGALTVTTYGTDVDLSQLTTPGFCRIMNLDETNFIEYGIWEPQLVRFFPLGEVQPGESYVIRLSRNLFEEFGYGPGTGTGTTGPGTNTFRLRAYNQSCVAVVEAFEA